MPLSELSHMATPSCVSKAGKQSSGAAKTQVQLLRKMERVAIGASHVVLVITETGQNSKIKEVLRDRRQETDPERGLVQIHTSQEQTNAGIQA